MNNELAYVTECEFKTLKTLA